MRVITGRKLREFWTVHADAEVALRTWYAVAKKAKWQKLVDVQASYAGAEAFGNYTVFNVKGNRYRLIVKVEYRLQIIFIRGVLTHAEYTKDKWK